MARNALIQIRRDTAANWTSANPTLAAGEMGLETDTGRYKIGNGTTPWNALGINLTVDSLAAETLVEGGALISYNQAVIGTDLSVGNDLQVANNATISGTSNIIGGVFLGDGIVDADSISADSISADSISQSGDYLSPYNGFRNAIINGDFRINQRGFTSITASDTYGFDRWAFQASGGTSTMTPQTFTVGSPAATGFESANFFRLVTASQSGVNDYSIFYQKIEDVRNFANSTITVSFWAKAASGTPKIAVEFGQVFGTGGTPSAGVNTYAGQSTISTSWARYSITATVPSISGKTIGTTANTSLLGMNFWVSAGSTFNSRTGSIGIQNNTFDIWGVQVERGSVATPFEQRPIGTELALCQRYYFRNETNLALSMPLIAVGGDNVNYCTFNFPVQMRAAPNISISSIVAEGHHTNAPTVAGSNVNLVGFEYNGANERSPGIRLNIGVLIAEKEL